MFYRKKVICQRKAEDAVHYRSFFLKLLDYAMVSSREQTRSDNDLLLGESSRDPRYPVSPAPTGIVNTQFRIRFGTGSMTRGRNGIETMIRERVIHPRDISFSFGHCMVTDVRYTIKAIHWTSPTLLSGLVTDVTCNFLSHISGETQIVIDSCFDVAREAQ